VKPKQSTTEATRKLLSAGSEGAEEGPSSRRMGKEKSAAAMARIKREQELMRRMGEKKNEHDVAKSLGSDPPQGKGVIACFTSMLGWGGGNQAKSSDPLWGGDASKVELPPQDGYYRPMGGR